MENKENSRTLEEGFLESKLEHNDGILEEFDSVPLFNLSEKAVFDVYGGKDEVKYNGSIVESSVCADKLLVLTSNETGDVKVHDLEEGLKCSENEAILVEKFDDRLYCDEVFPMEENDHVLHPHEPGSPTRIDVCGSGINLFVEVFGPVDGVSESSSNANDKENDGSIVKNVSGKNEGEDIVGEVIGPLDGVSGISNNKEGLEFGENDVNREFMLEENGSIFKNVSCKNEGEDIVGEQRFTFDIGDLVWVKTQTQVWWPGMISDPANAPNDAMKSGTGGSFLVKYFGSANFVWFESSDLKPFLEYFDRMSGQNNSKNFFGSVEKALCEINHRLKSLITCSCFSKDSQAPVVERSSDKTSGLDIVSLSKFEPVSFLARVRHLASSANVPSKLELLVMKSLLSAFYCSVGHLNLPLQMLVDDKNSSKPRDGKRNHVDVASPGKGFESRERKKSKYLTYPYVDVIKEASTLGQETGQSIKSTPPATCTNSRKKWSKKSVKVLNMVCKETDDINACSSDLLTELRLVGRDCFYLSRSNYSDSLVRFYRSFRIFSFLSADVECKDVGIQPASNVKQRLPEDSTKAAVQLEAKNGKVNLLSVQETIENAEGNVKRKKAKKKEQVVISETPNSTNYSFTKGTNVYPDSTFVINFQQPPSELLPPTPKIVEDATNPQINFSANPSFSMDHVGVGGQSTTLGESLPEQKDKLALPNIISGNQSVFPTVPSLMIQNISQLNNGTNQYWNGGGFTARELGTNVMMNTGLGSFVHQSLQMGMFTSAATPKYNKRKQMENTPSPIPDLNGNVNLNLNLNVPHGNPILSPVGETQQKKTASTEPGSTNMKTNRVAEPIGGTLVLNFAPESSAVPSKEILVATFSRFGLLKESEIQVLEDSSVRIPYERISEARFAYRSIEKNNPFGASLPNFKLECDAAALKMKEKKKNLQSPRPLVVPVDPSKHRETPKTPVVPLKTPVPSKTPGKMPDIALMKQNVETMKMTLEKVGNSLSAEMRSKLENEIKVFLDKISSGSSST